MRGVPFVCAVAIACLLPASAVAGVTSQREGPGDVRARGLTRAERSALDIVSVRTTGDESNGLFVTVTFRGDMERRLGQGHLKRALVALVLRPKSSAQAPAGLVTRGGGYRVRTLAIARKSGRGGYRVQRRRLRVFGRERVQRRTTATQVGALRRGNRILFYVEGPGLSNVGFVEVKAYVRPPRGAGRAGTAQAPPKIPTIDWLAILDNDRDPADLAGAGVDAATLNCQQLKGLRAELVTRRAEAEKDLERYEPILKSYRNAVETYSNTAYQLAKAKGQFYATKEELQQVVTTYEQIIKRLKAITKITTRLIKELDALLKQRCQPPAAGANKPPVITSFKAVFGTHCATCTLYTVTANDPEGQALTYSWSKSPPPGGQPAATNCGTFTANSPAENQAVWDHPNDGANACSHTAADHPGHIAVVVTDAQGGQTVLTDTHGSADFTYP